MDFIPHLRPGRVSGGETWENITASIVSGLDGAIEGGALHSRGVYFQLTPRIRDLLDFGTRRDTQDDFEVVRVYLTRCRGFLTIRFRGRFASDGAGAAVFVLDSVGPVDMEFTNRSCAGALSFFSGLGADPAALEAQVVDTVTAQLTTQLESQLSAGLRVALAQRVVRDVDCSDPPGPSPSCVQSISRDLGLVGVDPTIVTSAHTECVPRDEMASVCRFVPPVHRLSTGPVGLELVFAEDASDPFYPAYSFGGVCDRSAQPYVLDGRSFGAISGSDWRSLVASGGGGCGVAPRSPAGFSALWAVVVGACVWVTRRRRR